jgi:hypothetical protein
MALLLDEAIDFSLLADHNLDDSSSEGVRRRAHVPLVQMGRKPQMAKEKVAQVEAVRIAQGFQQSLICAF